MNEYMSGRSSIQPNKRYAHLDECLREAAIESDRRGERLLEKLAQARAELAAEREKGQIVQPASNYAQHIAEGKTDLNAPHSAQTPDTSYKSSIHGAKTSLLSGEPENFDPTASQSGYVKPPQARNTED